MSEEQAIAAFNLGDAAKTLRDKIRHAFVELIPPEQWEAMVKKELESFTKESVGVDQWGRSKTQPSVFSEVCKEVYRERLTEQVKALLASPEWQGSYNGTGVKASAAIQEWLTINADKLLIVVLNQMFGGVAQRMVQEMQSLR